MQTALYISKNRYCEVAVAFFLHEKRLSQPTYSELFQDILMHEVSSRLRNYMSQKDCTDKLLSVCFERPLAIIRAEKINKSKMERSEILRMHGINDVGKKKSTDAGNERNKTEPMTNEALELQYQGLRLIQTLTENDETYLESSKHPGVIMRYRWLWRAKGRYLRLLHEDFLPAKYQAESRLIAVFLMKYVEKNPSEIDILFELLRIFLQPTASDFSFVTRFIEYMVTKVLTRELKHKVLMRFFDVLASEGTEETKVLSLELIVLPILSAGTYKHVDHHKSYWEPTKLSWITELSYESQKFLKGKESNETVNQEKESNDEQVVDAIFVKRFMQEALLKGSSNRGFGDRLQTELLKVSTLLIENFRDGMVEFRKDLIKFAWNHLKTEDSGSKHWAYVNVSRFISVYDTPPKIILQVYLALLRATQPECKYLVRTSLDILVPCLPRRLPRADFEAGIRWTKRIVYEENHSIPQISHIWSTVVRHPKVFFFYRQEFIPLMVNSINRLGLTATCSLETRALSVALVDVIISWEECAQEFGEELQVIGPKRRNPSIDSNYSKKRKLDESLSLKSNLNTERKVTILNQSMADIIANFLVRICSLTSEMAAESGHPRLGQLSVILFGRLMKQWGAFTEIHAAYFEKIFASCVNESRFGKSEVRMNMASSNMQKGPQKPFNYANSVQGKNEVNKRGTEQVVKEGSIQQSTLLMFLDLFIAVSEFAPKNSFFKKNSMKIIDFIRTCFSRSLAAGGYQIRQKLKHFGYLLISNYNIQSNQIDVFHTIKFCIETVISMAVKEIDGVSPPNNGVRKPSDTSKNQSKVKDGNEGSDEDDAFEVGRVGGRCSAFFVVQLIEDVSRTQKNFVEHFTGILLLLAERITCKIAKLKTSGSQIRRNAKHEVLATPTISIMEEACENGFRFAHSHMTRNSTKSSQKSSGVTEVLEPGSAIRTLISCLRLLSMSSIPYSFTQQRIGFFKIISRILEACDNIPLLITVVGILGTWLSNGGGPMTAKERKAFLWKITDIRFLPEIPAQALLDIISRLVLSLFKKRSKLFGPMYTNDGGEQIPATGTSSGDAVDIGSCFHKALVSNLLSTNPDLRSRLISSFGSSFFEDLKKTLQNKEEAICHIDFLWKLLYCEWEGIGDRFWIVAFVESFLSICTNRRSTKLVERKNQSTFITKSEFQLVNPKKVHNSKDGNSFSLAKFEDFLQFRKVLNHNLLDGLNQSSSILSALGILAHGNLDLCEQLFQSCLSNVWKSIDNDEIRLGFGPAFESLLSRPYFSQFVHTSSLLPKFSHASMQPSKSYINVVQVWLRGIRNLSPMPFFDPDLLVPLASTFNAWHESIEILQRQYSAIEASSEYSIMKEKVFCALRKCYDKIGEKDISLALMIDPSEMPGTKRAISLDLYVKVEHALNCYKHLVDEVDNESSWALPPSEVELSFWEERWLDINKELCQWTVLTDYAKSSGSPNLLVESAWKSRDWTALRNLSMSPSIIADLENGNPLIKITEIFLAIADGKLNDVEHLHAQTAQLCLHQWQLLPSITNACGAQKSLLQTFHRLVELRESGQIMLEISKHAKNRTFPDLKNLLG